MKTNHLRPQVLFGALCAAMSLIAARADVSVNIGTLAPGQSVTITYDVTIDTPISPGVTTISSQGTISGSNFSTVSTDDPETPAANDPTVTTLSVPVAVTDTIFRAPFDDVKVKVSTLLANDIDPEND